MCEIFAMSSLFKEIFKHHWMSFPDTEVQPVATKTVGELFFMKKVMFTLSMNLRL
jgi:hypothetical protein